METNTGVRGPECRDRVDVPEPGTYSIDAGASEVTVVVGHLFGLGLVSGLCRLRFGQVVVGEPLGGSVVRVVVAAESFDTGNPARDRTVRGRRLLDVGRFPDLLFTGVHLHRCRQGWRLEGRLRVRDVVSDVSIDIVQCRVDSGVLRLRGAAELDRVAAGVRGLRGLVGRRVRVDLAVAAVADAGRAPR